MKLPAEKLTQAVNLAINDHIPLGQTRSGALSDWKGLADAEAGRNAVFAAMLARGGVTGPTPIFEGKKGLFELVTGPAPVDVAAFGRRGIPFKIMQCGMKAYPVVVYGQTTIPAAIAVAKDVVNLDRITAMEIETTKRGYQQAGSDPEKWAPGFKGHGRPQPALHRGADDVRRRHQQRQLRTRKASRSAHPRLHAQDHGQGGPGVRDAARQRALDPHHRRPRRRQAHRAPGRRHAGLSRGSR